MAKKKKRNITKDDNMFNTLIGKSIIGFESETEDKAWLLISDGSKVEIERNPEPDCCGGNDFTVDIPKEFDFNDNIIMKVDYVEEEDSCEASGTVTLGVFTNNATITVEGSYGSGSGWDYGQFVSIKLVTE